MTPDPVATALSALKRRAAQATPGPFDVEQPLGDGTWCVVPAGKPTYEWVFVAVCSADEPEDDPPKLTVREAEANANYIAACSPALIAALCDVALANFATQSAYGDTARLVAINQRRDALRRLAAVIKETGNG